MGQLVGYGRVSTTDQDLTNQREALTEAGCEKIFAEQQSGRSAADRVELAAALDWVREGDVLVVTRLDRLARSVSDLFQIIDRLQKKGCGFRCLSQDIDTTTPTGRLMMTMLGAVAEFELSILDERRKEGIAKAKAEGRYKGGTKQIDEKAVRALHATGVTSATAIAKTLKCHRSSVYRAAPDLWDAPPESLRKGG